MPQDVHRRAGVRGHALGRRPAVGEAYSDELRPAGAAVGRVERDLPADQARREGERQDHHPRRHEGAFGKADKTTVFADGLYAHPHRFRALYDGPALHVANSTELVHLGAVQASARRPTSRCVLLSGFGTEDTHHIIHTAWLGSGLPTVLQPVHLHSQPHRDTARREARLNAGGIWRFNPDRTELDVFARGWVNAWGHAFDKYGQSLVTDGLCLAARVSKLTAVPGGYYLNVGRSASPSGIAARAQPLFR